MSKPESEKLEILLAPGQFRDVQDVFARGSRGRTDLITATEQDPIKAYEGLDASLYAVIEGGTDPNELRTDSMFGLNRIHRGRKTRLLPRLDHHVLGQETEVVLVIDKAVKPLDLLLGRHSMPGKDEVDSISFVVPGVRAS